MLFDSIKDYLSIHSERGKEEEYRLALQNGVRLLFSCKKYYSDYSSMRESFYRAKQELLDLDFLNEYNEELLIEMEAVIINHYNMPDFWASSIGDFINDEFFRRYYTRKGDA